MKLSDSDSGEDLVFYLDRWLAKDQDDGQICREMPAVRKGTAALPGILSHQIVRNTLVPDTNRVHTDPHTYLSSMIKGYTIS